MSKKVKVLIGVLVAVLIMTFGGTAVAMADDGDETQPALQSALGIVAGRFLARVAEILEVPEGDLVNAFQQAWGEMGGEVQSRFMKSEGLIQEKINKFQEQKMKREQIRQKIQNKVLGKAVEKGRISENATAEIKGWWESRPGALDDVIPRARVFKAIRGRHMIAVPNDWQGQIPNQPAE